MKTGTVPTPVMSMWWTKLGMMIINDLLKISMKEYYNFVTF
jgi:hypothetical protein